MIIEPGNSINSQRSESGRTRQHANVDTEKGNRQTEDNPDGRGAEDSVSLSPAGQTLANVEAKLAETGDIDSAKVAEIKAMLASGSYQIDARAVAQGLIDQETQLG